VPIARPRCWLLEATEYPLPVAVVTLPDGETPTAKICPHEVSPSGTVTYSPAQTSPESRVMVTGPCPLPFHLKTAEAGEPPSRSYRRAVRVYVQPAMADATVQNANKLIHRVMLPSIQAA